MNPKTKTILKKILAYVMASVVLMLIYFVIAFVLDLIFNLFGDEDEISIISTAATCIFLMVIFVVCDIINNRKKGIDRSDDIIRICRRILTTTTVMFVGSLAMEGLIQRFSDDDFSLGLLHWLSFALAVALFDELVKMVVSAVGRLDNVAEGERVYSVRFMGDIGYFVTFRQTDPLFSVDLSNPKEPKLLGQLKIPGFSEYMYPYGDGLLLGFGMEADEKTGRTSYLKLSMFNTSNPADLTEQDKTVIDPFTYSEALYNHKAMLVSVSKNLIGFPANDNNGNQGYFVYEYTGDGFAKKAALELKVDYKYAYEPNIRGMFIGDYFYIVNGTALWCFDLNDFAQLAVIK